MLLPSFYLKRGSASKEIDLAGTNVSGDISALFQWKQLEEVDLSGTQMSGRLGRAWRGQVPELRILKLTNCKRLAFIPTGREGDGASGAVWKQNFEWSFFKS